MPGPRKNLTPLDMKMMGLTYNQGGILNFLGKQPEVTAPIRAQSHADSPPTQLAYITDAEKDLLVKSNIHGSMEGKPNLGPAGLESLDDFFVTPGGGAVVGVSGGDYDQSPSSAPDPQDYGIGPGQAVSSSGQVFEQPQGGGPGSWQQVSPAVQAAAVQAANQQAAAAQAAVVAQAEEEKKKKEQEALDKTSESFRSKIMTSLMGGGVGGDPTVVKPAQQPGKHKLRAQKDYL